jgi:hypothetical protein
MPRTPEYLLVVADLSPKDFDIGVARLYLNAIHAKEGDCLEIRGQRITYARAGRHYPSDKNIRHVLKTDPNTRRNASVDLGDNVYVSRVTSVPSAESLIVTELEGRKLHVEEGLLSFLGRSWPDRYATVGDVLSATVLGGPLDFRVVGYSPASKVVQITEKSKIEIREPAKTGTGPEIEPDEIDRALEQAIRASCEKYGLGIGKNDKNWISYGEGENIEAIMARLVRDVKSKTVYIYETSSPEELNMRGRNAFDSLYNEIRGALPKNHKVIVSESHVARIFELTKMSKS